MVKKELIDIQEAFREKSPRLARMVPSFLFNFLARLIHQDEMNAIIEKYEETEGVEFMEALMHEFDLHIRVEGEEHIPTKDQRALFVSNHPLGGLDGVCLTAFLGRRYDDQVRCLVNDLLMFIPQLRTLFVPVNKHGSQGREVLKRIEEVYGSDLQLLTFPAGLCSRKIGGVVQDLPWQKSFISRAIKYQRDVVPLYFDGQNSPFFYRLANIRRAVGVKMNIEMLYLPDEMFKNQHQTFRLCFGKPIPWQCFDHRRNATEWAAWVRKQVYEMSTTRDAGMCHDK